MFSLFSRKQSIVDSSLLVGAVDNHSHILYGVDDGVKAPSESLAILKWLEGKGLKELWLTPHIMEDVPNTTEGLKSRFAELLDIYHGNIKLHLAAEYMMDNLYEERLSAGDLLFHGEDRVLVETSTMAPPLDLWGVLGRTMSNGYRPLLAHPERYMYMSLDDYSKLIDMGVQLQLNLPSIVGFYGPQVRKRAEWLLNKGMYTMAGSDCHRFKVVHHQYRSPELKKGTVAKLKPILL